MAANKTTGQDLRGALANGSRPRGGLLLWAPTTLGWQDGCLDGSFRYCVCYITFHGTFALFLAADISSASLVGSSMGSPLPTSLPHFFSLSPPRALCPCLSYFLHGRGPPTLALWLVLLDVSFCGSRGHKTQQILAVQYRTPRELLGTCLGADVRHATPPPCLRNPGQRPPFSTSRK